MEKMIKNRTTDIWDENVSVLCICGIQFSLQINEVSNASNALFSAVRSTGLKNEIFREPLLASRSGLMRTVRKEGRKRDSV
jgi:hypothetical protein